MLHSAVKSQKILGLEKSEQENPSPATASKLIIAIVIFAYFSQSLHIDVSLICDNA